MELLVPGGQVWADDSGGEGPTVVLLHPGWGDSAIWLPVMERLPAHYRVIRYDVHGYGKSPAPAAPFTQLGDLIGVLDHLAADRVLLVGHSGGGGTAIGLALADPARVSGLLLLAPGVPDYPWPPDDPYFLRFAEFYEADDRNGLTELGLRTWAPADPGPPARDQVRGAVDAFYAIAGFEQHDPPAWARLAEIDAPSVVVVGGLEYPMVVHCAEEVAARIPGCRRVLAKGADHLLPLRVPDLIADLIANLAG
ncbi:MAG TPA: alpha/beta hydrolase [Trebonia sp.]|jgi:3-oxoadipate enol-lactonase|nr:alpha/beta hydrolase [Trebonia sp.]